MSEKLAMLGGQRTVPKGAAVRWPVITAEDKKAVMEVLDRGVLCGPYAPAVKALEADWSSYVGTKHALSTNSGTAALHIAVAAAGVGPGDEVITTSFTFLASALAVLQHHGVPVFCDIDPKSYNIDVSQIEKKITRRTKAILPVHIHGLPCDMDEIMAIARKHGLVVIEDAAQAHGATYKGKKTGSIGDMGCFSLQASKNLPAGEGGLFCTDNTEMRHTANMVRMFGENIHDDLKSKMDPDYPLEDPREYNAYMMGWMYRSTEMTAALARSQLGRLDANNANARRNGEYLTGHLSEIKGIVPPQVPSDRTSVYHKYRIRLDARAAGLDVPAVKFRDAVMQALAYEGVEVALWQTKPLPGQALFQERKGYGKGAPWSCHYDGEVSYDVAQFPETKRLLEETILVGAESYPLFPQPLELMEKYVAAFRKVFASKATLEAAIGAAR